MRRAIIIVLSLIVGGWFAYMLLGLAVTRNWIG